MPTFKLKANFKYNNLLSFIQVKETFTDTMSYNKIFFITFVFSTSFPHFNFFLQHLLLTQEFLLFKEN